MSEEPVVPGGALGAYVESLTTRYRGIKADAIVLIKGTVCDAAYGPLKFADQSVSSELIPFPGSGRQREFEQAFARALEGMGGSGLVHRSRCVIRERVDPKTLDDTLALLGFEDDRGTDPSERITPLSTATAG